MWIQRRPAASRISGSAMPSGTTRSADPTGRRFRARGRGRGSPIVGTREWYAPDRSCHAALDQEPRALSDARKRPKELVRGPASRLADGSEQVRSLRRSAQVPRSLALRPSNLVPGTVPRIAPRCGLAVRTRPFGQDGMYPAVPGGHNGLIHEVAEGCREVIPELPTD